ncbi:MAG: TIR domain-containing protein [Cytophagales bacterium]|nr:TIR domain-containing protein [Cytophagales bacterium]
MSKTIFLSYRVVDEKYKKKVVDWAEEGKLGNGVKVLHQMDQGRPLTGNEIKGLIKPKIKGVAMVLILVGNDTHNSNWIKWEIELSKMDNKAIYWMQAPGTSGAPPYELKKIPKIEFNSNSIKSRL